MAVLLQERSCAGSMESSSGSASVTPTPRRKVRRGRCFFVMNMIFPKTLKEVTNFYVSMLPKVAS